MTPRVALLTIGDGRDDLLDRAMTSLYAAIGVPDEEDGSPFVAHVHVDDREHRLGFCGAIREGWARLRAAHETHPFDYVFHLEEDWEILGPLDLARMADLLDLNPALVQVALRRGAEPGEHPDGPIGAWPDEYTDCAIIDPGPAGANTAWLRHSLFFTTNPSLYRESLLDNDWPEGPGCERVFGDQLRDNGRCFAFWGARSDEPLVLHTGRGARRGRGY